jgi:hypothetical protein
LSTDQGVKYNVLTDFFPLGMLRRGDGFKVLTNMDVGNQKYITTTAEKLPQAGQTSRSDINLVKIHVTL